MADKPILFSAPMVRALLDGRKTQTRRLLKPQPLEWAEAVEIAPYKGYGRAGQLIQRTLDDQRQAGLGRAPYQATDRLWAREAWKTPGSLDDLSPRQIEAQCKELGYAGPWCPRVTVADNLAHQWSEEDGFKEDEPSGRLRAAMHMPRWASRLTLIVTDVRVQRVQEISADDCLAEGIEANDAGLVVVEGAPPMTAKAAYRALWDSLNAKRGHGWETNPWVVAVTFTIHQQNIDTQKGGDSER